MQAVTIPTASGPITIDTEPGNVERPIRVKLGQGFASVTVFLTVEQACLIDNAVRFAVSSLYPETTR
jgi:hypothetical protein